MRARAFEGDLDAAGLRFGIVTARFNSIVCDRLQEAAVAALEKHGADPDAVTIVRVPGAYEVPQAARKLADSKSYDAIIGLGAVVRGETPHFDYICDAAARGLSDVAAATGVPVIFGVLTTDTMDQALARSGGEAGDKGAEAAACAVEMATLYSKLNDG